MTRGTSFVLTNVLYNLLDQRLGVTLRRLTAQMLHRLMFVLWANPNGVAQDGTRTSTLVSHTLMSEHNDE